MRKGRKRAQRAPQQVAAAGAQQSNDQVRFRVRDEIVEFVPTADAPVLIKNTATYESWIDGVVDTTTSARITLGVAKMRRGLLGDWKEIGDGVIELRLDFGPGYRVYYARVGRLLIVLLGGGDKGSQQRDIANAKKIWMELRDEIAQL